MINDVTIQLWGSTIGAATWVPEKRVAVFQYDPDFAKSGIEIAPIRMPLREFPYEFPTLPGATFKGLPGLLEDSLPDTYGNAVLDVWYALNGRIPEEINSVQRLATIARNGMGALEFKQKGQIPTKGALVKVQDLANVANRVVGAGGAVTIPTDGGRRVTLEMLRAGMYAGGASPKAIVAWNPQTDEFRTDSDRLPPDFEYWLIKFESTSPSTAHDGTELPPQSGRIEYAYSLLAKRAGITMSPCSLYEDQERRHFMTKRFDRLEGGGRVHMQSLAALGHYDYNKPGSNSYEQCIQIMRRLLLPVEDFQQQVLRALFNIILRNQDDHTKNISFLMGRSGDWRLAPAFDVTFAYVPDGRWTSRHQMSLNGKRDKFEPEDLLAFAAYAGFKPSQANEMIHRVLEAADAWPEVASQAGVDAVWIREIEKFFRRFAV